MCVTRDQLEKIECADYFGHRISTNSKESMCKAAIPSFWMYFNMFMYDFGHRYSFIESELSKIYCCNFHGALPWFLYGSVVRNVCVEWR